MSPRAREQGAILYPDEVTEDGPKTTHANNGPSHFVESQVWQ